MTGSPLKVTGEEPQVGLHVQLGHDPALAVLAALRLDMRNSVEHQHWRQGQLRIARAKQLAPAAGKQILVVEAGLPFRQWFLHADLSFIRNVIHLVGWFPNTWMVPQKARLASPIRRPFFGRSPDTGQSAKLSARA